MQDCFISSMANRSFCVLVFALLQLLELVYGQCILNIELIQFRNLYSLEIRPNWGSNDICCCDVSTCHNSADQFSLETCESRCDTYFVLSFTECQDFSPCPVTMITDVSTDSNTTTNVNYKFYIIVRSSAIESVAFDIVMRDEDPNGYREIDTFNIMATFPPDNQSEVFNGSRGIATITLKYNIVCIEPEACKTIVASSELIATPRIITVTKTVSVNSSPNETYGEQPVASFDGKWIVWMSLFVVFVILTILFMMISIYLACLLKKKSKFKVSSKAGSNTLVQTHTLPPMDNPVYGSQEISGLNEAENGVQSEEVYHTLANSLYANTSASTSHDYSKCGPAESPGIIENCTYVQTREQMDEREAFPYEVPLPHATSK